jgi:hypothetical protein
MLNFTHTEAGTALANRALMAWRLLIAVVFVVLFSGCAATRYETIPRLVEQTEVRSKQTPQSKVFTVDYKYDFGILSGKLEFTSNCRRVVTEHWQDERFRVTSPKPNTTAVTVSGGVAAVSGAISLLLLSNLEIFPDSSENTDRDSVLLNRRQAVSVGVTAGIASLLATGIALGTVFIASKDVELEQTLVSSRKRSTSSETPEHMPCGTGAPARVRLALVRDQVPLAEASTDKDGNFTMWLPADTRGTVRLAVVSVPEGMVQVERGTDIVAFDLREGR